MNVNQLGNQMQPNQAISTNRGGHELIDTHEVLSCMINMLEQYQLYDQHIQDPELKSIVQRQSAFATQLYNTIVESFQTGQKPTVSTQVYNMTQNHQFEYGMKPGQPKKPKSSVSELTDECFSSFMLEHTKSLSPLLATTALEMTNPVLRRVLADSVPNFIEMSYEISLYQNKHGYYQVPQLMEQDEQLLLNSYTKAPQQGMTH
ncbi:spore coat protein [Oceanobacillus piezotolerans]|uniref:Spore coat protein n=2 Tax=Oceanobacillus piezotolerans TaxID=2448030 RepID=A0A498D3X7_9BACI|nr:spore coat protein [Oceanobacillus piezotolerans]RLL42941.1 spore coat protein [Oceanobacillus piezotolerans]